jgi:hypothetical protein
MCEAQLSLLVSRISPHRLRGSAAIDAQSNCTLPGPEVRLPLYGQKDAYVARNWAQTAPNLFGSNTEDFCQKIGKNGGKAG